MVAVVSNRPSSNKRYRSLVKLAKKWGRHVVVTKTHMHLVCNRGERPTVVASTSPSCKRGELNMVADLRKNDRPYET